MRRGAALIAIVSFASLLAVASACSSSGNGDTPASTDSVRLVVAVVVDQLRPDMLERFDDAFEGGFRRLIDDGFAFAEGYHDHGVTHTGPGHATLSTGVFPARHGVVANEWRERRDGEWVSVYAVEDRESALVGVDSGTGRSPRNLERTGLADWIVEADSAARVAAFSKKDRSAITLAGQAQGQVYWASASRGRFITSQFYRDELAPWVADFNAVEMAEIRAITEWESLIPDELTYLSRPDTSEFENPTGPSYFPHRFEDEDREDTEARRNAWVIDHTPAADVAVLGIASRGLRELELGQRGVVDYLAISFSSTDLVGHDAGPFSREQLDNLMRLDRLLGELMDLLDREVGEGAWVLGLSSDHGILEIPEYAVDPPARRISPQDRAEMRDAVIAAGEAGTDPLEYADRVAAALQEVAVIGRATPAHRLLDVAETDTISAFQANSYRPDRVVGRFAELGVIIRLKERVLDQASRRGTTHGTPYQYDRHVPLFFYGAGVSAGRSSARVSTVDFAPTLAALAGVEFPRDLDGRPLSPFWSDSPPQLP